MILCGYTRRKLKNETMQLSEVVRRSILVPKSSAAMKLIETDQFSEAWIDEYLVMPIGDEFCLIYASGLFDEINIICDSHIDDYFEEVIPYEKQILLITFLSRKGRTFPPDVTIFCNKLKTLCTESLATHMPMYFIL